MYLSYGHFHSTLHWCARDWTTRAGHKKKITQRKFSLETTLRPELIPGYQAWTSAPELPVPRWEDLINTFQKSNSYHLFKIYIRSQDWYFEARSINFQKQTDQRRVTPRQQIWLQDCIYSDEEGQFHWETVYRMALRCTKAPSLLSFNFKLLHRRIATNDFFT